jgi:hypothetical protein
MTRYARAFLLALAIALSAACSRPNLESTGGGYGPASSAPATEDQARAATLG